MTGLILVPILLFFAALSAAAVWAERSTKERTLRAGFAADYFLGSRSLQGVVLAMTLFATYGSVSSFVSGPGIAWSVGCAWVAFAAPQMIAGFFLLGLMGSRMALVSRRIGAITVIDLLRTRYESRGFAVFAAVALLIFFTTMMTGQFIGGAAIFAEAAGLSTEAALALFGILVVLYTSMGGYRAVAWTDAVCAVLMLSGLVMLGWAILGDAGGLEAAALNAAASAPSGEHAFLSPTADGAIPATLLFSAWILVGFGTAGLPQSAVRCMSYASTRDLKLAIVIGTVVCGALMIGLTALGFLARGLPDLGLAPGTSTDHLIPKLIAERMNPWAAGITLIGPIAATMSTVSSLLIAASSAIVKDLLIASNPALEADERKLKRIARVSTLALGILAMAAALKPLDLVAWINLAAFGGLELTFLLPLAGGLYWKRANRAGAFGSAAGGLAVYGALLLLKPDLAGFHPIVPAFAAAGVFFILGSLFGKPSSEEALRPFFPHGKGGRH